MKKLLIALAVALAITPAIAMAQMTVPQGGTGQTSFPLNSLIYSQSTLRLAATSSNPLTIGSFIATSTATSTAAGGLKVPNLAVSNLSAGCAQFGAGGYILSTGSNCGTGSGTVTSVGAASPLSTLTVGGVNPVTGAGTINFDINLANINSWTARQSFSNASTTQLTLQGALFDGNNSNGTGGFVLMSRGGVNSPTWVATSSLGTVTSVATNNGLTGGTITTSGTIGFDLTALPVNNLLLTYNGSRLTATGTDATGLTVSKLVATSTATSTFAGDVKAANLAATSVSAGCATVGAGGFIGSTGTACASAGGGGKTLTYMGQTATSSPDGSWVSTTTPMVAGGEVQFWGSCSRANTGSLASLHLDVNISGGTSTVTWIQTASAANSAQVNWNGYFQATTTATARISLTQSDDTPFPGSSCTAWSMMLSVYSN